MLDQDAIRASWETERENLTAFLMEKRFNPKYVDRVVTNFIETMVFARLPCKSEEAIKSAYRSFLRSQG